MTSHILKSLDTTWIVGNSAPLLYYGKVVIARSQSFCQLVQAGREESKRVEEDQLIYKQHLHTLRIKGDGINVFQAVLHCV